MRNADKNYIIIIVNKKDLSMVISILKFGLGNQMFQYAMGKAIANKCKDSLILALLQKMDSRNATTTM